ncbi:glycosyltransferase [Egbenema bharatensis]|uniref:glycosyltransferase n=1 Tax=Egbenema bharatensis TaxID=3463334 RepID=UPI003A8A0618
MDTKANQEDQNPLVSCIIIFFDAEEFFEEAIESVFAQTYTNWELILVDDGSTDGSTAIAQKYAWNYPNKVRYLEHKGHQNCGMSATRNLGIRHARGEYIALLDADDVWLPHKLKEQVAILNCHSDAVMVYGPALNWFSWSGIENAHKDFLDSVRYPNQLMQPPNLIALFLTGGDFIPEPSCILVRHSFAEKIGGFEEIFRGMYEDQAFYAKLCLTAPVFVASECWFKYRQHENSCCSIALRKGQEHQARKFFLRWLDSFLYEKNVTDAELLYILKSELWRCQYPILHETQSHIQSFMRNAKVNMRSIYKTTFFKYWLNPLKKSHKNSPPLGRVNLGDMKRLTPICKDFGLERGLPIDRYYIEKFLAGHIPDIQGHVLEIQEPLYTYKFGGNRITKSDVLHIETGNPRATIVADLTRAHHLPSNTFDCIILTQTLQFLYDISAATKTLYRILKPGGILLVTVSGISQISRGDMERSGHYWSFTTLSVQRLFEECFDHTKIEVTAYGNVLSAIALLHGIVTEEIEQSKLDYHDPDYQVLITARCVKQ